MIPVAFSIRTNLKRLFAVTFLQCGFLLIFALLLTQAASPQASTQPAMTSRESISNELKLIEDAPHWHATDIQLGRLWGHLAFDYQNEGDMQLSEEAYLRAIGFLRTVSSAQSDYATALDNLGSLYLEIGRMKESENYKRKGLAVREAIGDHLGAARVRAQLAIVLVNQHKYKEAEQQALTALQGMQEQQDSDTTDVAATLLPLSFARCLQDRCNEGLADADRAVAILRSAVPSDPQQAGTAWLVGAAWLTLGFAQWKTGANTDAETSMRESVRILRSQTGLPDAVLLWALVQYSDYLKAMHRKVEARQLNDEIERLTSQEARACRSCTIDVHAFTNAMW